MDSIHILREIINNYSHINQNLEKLKELDKDNISNNKILDSLIIQNNKISKILGLSI